MKYEPLLPSDDVFLAALKKALTMEEAPEVKMFIYEVVITDMQKSGFKIRVQAGDRLYRTKYNNYYVKHHDNTCTWYGDGQKKPFPVERIDKPTHAVRISRRVIFQ